MIVSTQEFIKDFKLSGFDFYSFLSPKQVTKEVVTSRNSKIEIPDFKEQKYSDEHTEWAYLWLYLNQNPNKINDENVLKYIEVIPIKMFLENKKINLSKKTRTFLMMKTG